MLEEHREAPSTSYKDALLIAAAAPEDPSTAEDLLIKLLNDFQFEKCLQDSLTADIGLEDQVPSTIEMVNPKRKLQRSQRKKLIQSVSIKHDRPKMGPQTITLTGIVVSSNIQERKLLWESSNGVETLHLKKLDKKK